VLFLRNNGEFLMPQTTGERFKRFWKDIISQPQLQLMAMVGVIFLFLFHYLPMFGLIFAFKDVDYAVDVMGALKTGDWVGFDYFIEFVTDRNFGNIMMNTIVLSFLQLIITMPCSLLFALILSEIRSPSLKSGIQVVSFFPNFVSWIVYGSIIISMLSVDTGVVNHLLMKLGIISQPTMFLEDPDKFYGIMVVSNLMKNVGWGSVIYMSAISTIDGSLYEAAKIDGANRVQRILHITIPSIIAMIFVNLIFNLSQVLNSDFAQIWMFQRPLNLSRSEVLDIYIAKTGFNSMRYSYVTAVGVFKGVIGTLLLVFGNKISSKLLGRRLF